MPGICDYEVYIPETFQTNGELSKRTSRTEAELLNYTGVERKPVAASGEDLFEKSFELAKQILKRKQFPKIDVVITGTTYPESKLAWYPSAVAIKRLGLKGAFGFDVSNGCNSFITTSQVAKNWILGSPSVQSVLVLVADRLSELVDLNDPNHQCIFGFADGAGAALITRNSQTKEILSYSGSTVADLAESQFLMRDQRHIWMNDNEEEDQLLIQTYREQYQKNIMGALNQVDLVPSDVDHFFMNQGDHKLISYLERTLELKPEAICRTHRQFGHVGNTDLLLGMLQRNDKIQSGDIIVFASSGLGYSFSAMVVRA